MNIQETQALAEKCAQENRARIYALSGELGVGKTSFSQFFLAAMGAQGPFTSPTFVIMKRYDLSHGPYARAYHMDCYRIGEADLAALDFKNLLDDPQNLFLIEWADRIEGAIPRDALWIYFSHGAGEGDRSIEIKNT